MGLCRSLYKPLETQSIKHEALETELALSESCIHQLAIELNFIPVFCFYYIQVCYNFNPEYNSTRMYVLRSFLTVLAFTVLVQGTTAVIFPWMWSLPYPNQDQQSDEAISHPRNLNLKKRNVSSADVNFTLVAQTPCRSDKACGRGKYCDQHYGNCQDHKVENAPCRRDSHCRKGMDCRFGKCQKTVDSSTVGARCKNDKDCGSNMCCAKQHGESICKLKLKLNSKCFVPEGGVEYTIDSICPCEDGLVCRMAHLLREEEFAWRFWTDYDHMRCQRI